MGRRGKSLASRFGSGRVSVPIRPFRRRSTVNAGTPSAVCPISGREVHCLPMSGVSALPGDLEIVAGATAADRASLWCLPRKGSAHHRSLNRTSSRSARENAGTVGKASAVGWLLTDALAPLSDQELPEGPCLTPCSTFDPVPPYRCRHIWATKVRAC